MRKQSKLLKINGIDMSMNELIEYLRVNNLKQENTIDSNKAYIHHCRNKWMLGFDHFLDKLEDVFKANVEILQIRSKKIETAKAREKKKEDFRKHKRQRKFIRYTHDGQEMICVGFGATEEEAKQDFLNSRKNAQGKIRIIEVM